MNLFQDSLSTPSVKELYVSPCKPLEACKYNELWHSRLPKIHWSNVVRNKHYICYRATHEEKVYAVAIWSSPVARFHDYDTILELRRLAILDESPFNTASYMLSKMIKDIRKRFPMIRRLISYQDTEVHTGTIYKASNWNATFYSRRKGKHWGTRQRNEEQTKVDKIRWEYFIASKEAE